jgi:hypothetical protein
MQIILHFSDNRVFTEEFKDRVENEIRDSLQASLGDLAKIETFRTHALLKEVLAQGMGYLDQVRTLDSVKTHFVTIDHANGMYRIQARQHDGYTSLNSQLRDEATTDDRKFVGRRAALLVERDFGLLGTVVEFPSAQTARIQFKGATAETPLENLIKKNDVFALAQISVGGPAPVGGIKPWTFLQVQEAPAKGACLCRFLGEGEDKQTLPTNAGNEVFRCIKLGTAQAPLNLRLVQYGSKTRAPVPGVQVQVRRTGYKDEADKDQASTDKNGLFPLKRDITYDQVAFVTLVFNNSIRGRVPVPIFDEASPVESPISTDAITKLFIEKELWERGFTIRSWW